MDKLLKALQTVSLGYSQGTVSADVLIKACDTYKDKIGFEDSYDYQVCVAKSLYDSMNGVPQDAEICKAILPGQTKMVDGVMYVYTATPGAKTQYDWRVVKKGSKSAQNVGRGHTLNPSQVDAKQKFVNDLFPKDLSSLKPVPGSHLGGSTGAKLMEDVNGNRYVVKEAGTGTLTTAHVEAEYLTNQLYDALGMRVPDYELYHKDDGSAVLVSKFLPGARPVGSQDWAELSKGIIADVLLANWDVYQNDDNCLVDAGGRLFRVDNGGSLDFRARGTQDSSKFTDDVVQTFKGMKQRASKIFSQVDEMDLIAQIDAAVAKKDDVINYLNESGQSKYAAILEARFKNLSKIKSHLQTEYNLKNPTVQPRKLKPAADMYRTFTSDELEDFWKNAPGSSARSKLFSNSGANGWELLNAICEERGFNARPRVVSDQEYWNHVAKAKHPQMFRGLTAGGGLSLAQCLASFKYDDQCFYGTYGIYGEGIYAHVNDSSKNHGNTKTTYMTSDAYRHGLGSYAGGSDDGVMLMAYEDDVKIAVVSDLVKEIKANPPVGGDPKTIKKLQKEVKDIKAELDKTQDDLKNLTKNTIDKVNADMHFDEQGIIDMHNVIDHTDWGEVDLDGNPAFPDWDDFVETKMVNWVKQQGGSIRKATGVIYFKLPNSRTEFSMSQYQYSGQGAIKQKNSFTQPYHYNVERFAQWMETEHVQKVAAERQYQVDNLGDKVQQLKDDITKLKADYAQKNDDLQKMHNPDPDADIMSAIYDSVVNHGSKEALGIYAAIKGYDALYQDHGNGSSNGFAIILNRSKVIVKK